MNENTLLAVAVASIAAVAVSCNLSGGAKMPATATDVQMECTKQKGDWRSDGFWSGNRCVFGNSPQNMAVGK